MNNRIDDLCEFYHKICDGLPFECNIDITVEDMVDILNEVERLKRLEVYDEKLASGLQEQIRYSQVLTRKVENLEIQLLLATEDANRLATELELEQNFGCQCIALRLHYERIEGDPNKTDLL
jgi:hypothetical protein